MGYMLRLELNDFGGATPISASLPVASVADGLARAGDWIVELLIADGQTRRDAEIASDDFVSLLEDSDPLWEVVAEDLPKLYAKEYPDFMRLAIDHVP